MATTRVGVADIFPLIYKTFVERAASHLPSLIAFAFFLFAILNSKAFEALFASKRKWLVKRKYFTIGLITVASALFASQLT